MSLIFLIIQRNSFLRILLVVFTSIAIVTALFVASESIIHKNNNFIRQFPPHVMFEKDTFNLEYNSYYLAGATNSRVFLANPTAPSHILQINLTAADTQHVRIALKDADDILFRNINVRIDSPNFYLVDGTVPIVFRGNIHNWFGGEKFNSPVYFNSTVPISKSSFVIRSTDAATNGYVLGNLHIDSATYNLSSDLLQKQIDGKFCVDGMLHFDAGNNRLVYLYYYRNEYIVADPTLKLLLRGNTIDTVSRARIKVATLSSDGTRMLAAPPLLVNRNSTLYRHFLLVNSSLVSKNEADDVLTRLAVIDIYDINTQDYKFSFYVRNFDNEQIRGLQVCGDELVILFYSHVLVCVLNTSLFGFEDRQGS
jgi:hypothetical protein